MREHASSQLPVETLTSGPRVLYLAPDFGTHRSEDSIPKTSTVINHEKAIIQLFSDHGYATLSGDQFDAANKNALGFLAGYSGDPRGTDEAIARLVGADMPRIFAPLESLQSDEPVVAKIPTVNQGFFKYLLESPDQKARFITWAIMGDNVRALLKHSNPVAEMNKMIAEVRNGNLDLPVQAGNHWFKLSDWIFEQFIQTPGKFYNSYRVVVDGFGTIHYSQIACSEVEKGEASAEPAVTEDPFHEMQYGGGQSIWNLLKNPASPFYIQPKQIVSNIAQGGRRILLGGQAVHDEINREVLTGLGIDPDNPRLSAELIAQSRQIGVLYRQFYPYVGIDFLTNAKNGKQVLLEINSRPNINPVLMGLPEKSSPDAVEMAVLKRILDSH